MCLPPSRFSFLTGVEGERRGLGLASLRLVFPGGDVGLGLVGADFVSTRERHQKCTLPRWMMRALSRGQ